MQKTGNVRRDVPVEKREIGPGNRSVDGRDRKHGQLRPPNIDSERGRGQFAGVDRPPPAGPAGLVRQHDGNEQAETQRRDGEVMSLEPKDRPADDISKQARESSADDDRKPRGNPEIGRPDSGWETPDGA